MNPIRSLVHELAKFGVVGSVNYVLDVAVFNVLIVGPLDHRPITAKTISTVLAATSSYFMNRHWTWRDRARSGLGREYGLFIVLSAVGLALTLGCLAFGEYVLHQDSWLARNIWGNVVGVGLGMVWRVLWVSSGGFFPAGGAGGGGGGAGPRAPLWP